MNNSQQDAAAPHHAAFRNPALPVIDRVRDLISRMTLEEKASQMLDVAPAIERLGLPAYEWWNECLHGVGRAGIATVFPQAIGLASSMHPELIHRVATAISDEARAKHHDAIEHREHRRYFGLTYWSPNINIFRDPRWGRGQETYGEDPYLTSRIGVEFVKGLQGDDPKYLKLVATPKHYAVHSGPESLRHGFDARISKRELYETYLPAFKACVQEGGALSVMGAYNRVNGEACCASATLLQQILRDEWGFDGFVVSDCGAVEDIYEHHMVFRRRETAVAAAVKAGLDLCCGGAYNGLVQSVQEGHLTEEDIDIALERLFSARFRLGMFDPPEMVPYAQIPMSVVACPEHRALALQAARESLVLLKNDGVLPLSPNIRTLGIIGPNANVPDVLLGNYNGTPTHFVTPFEGITQKAFPQMNVIYSAGCKLDAGTEAQIWEGGDVIQYADLIVVIAGITPEMEGEEGAGGGTGDRETLGLPASQQALLESAAKSGKPFVVVLLSGSPLGVSWVQEHANAVIQAWYPGEEGGTAIAEALFGEYNPGGRLPVTCYASLEQVPPFENYSMDGRTYRFMTAEPLYPFGYGLSYTTFSYDKLRVTPAPGKCNKPLTISVEVRNSGQVAGDEVVQLYVSDLEASVPVPLRSLQGFQRVHLQPGETRTVTFILLPEQLAVTGDDGKKFVESGAFRLSVGGVQPGHPVRATQESPVVEMVIEVV